MIKVYFAFEQASFSCKLLQTNALRGEQMAELWLACAINNANDWQASLATISQWVGRPWSAAVMHLQAKAPCCSPAFSVSLSLALFCFILFSLSLSLFAVPHSLSSSLILLPSPSLLRPNSNTFTKRHHYLRLQFSPCVRSVLLWLLNSRP